MASPRFSYYYKVRVFFLLGSSLIVNLSIFFSSETKYVLNVIISTRGGIILKGMLKAYLGPKHNHSLVVAPCLSIHAPCLLSFFFLNTFILEISNCILKFI